jgi:hypothetical protein
MPSWERDNLTIDINMDKNSISVHDRPREKTIMQLVNLNDKKEAMCTIGRFAPDENLKKTILQIIPSEWKKSFLKVCPKRRKRK